MSDNNFIIAAQAFAIAFIVCMFIRLFRRWRTKEEKEEKAYWERWVAETENNRLRFEHTKRLAEKLAESSRRKSITRAAKAKRRNISTLRIY